MKTEFSTRTCTLLATLVLTTSLTAAEAAKEQKTQRPPPDVSAPVNRANDQGTATDTSTRVEQRGTLPRPARGEEPQSTAARPEPDQVRRTGDAAGAQRMVAGSPPKTGSVQLATDDDASTRVLRRFDGLDIRTKDGDRVGTLKDVLVDKRTGTIAYVVVAAGGVLGVGETLHAVPIEGIQRSSSFRGFMVNTDEETFSKLPTLNKDDLDAGRIGITVEEHERAGEVFPSEGANNFAVKSTRSDPSQLQRASAYRGKSLQSGNQKVGNIEEIVVDWDTATVTALLDPDDNFAGTNSKYLVPLNRIEGRTEDDAMRTTVAKADFQQAHADTQAFAAADGAKVPPPRDSGKAVSADEANRPTGRTSAEQNPEGDPKLIQAAQKIREVMDADPVMTGANVRVSPESGKIVLRGVVIEASTKAKIEQTARQHGGGAQIDSSQINVLGGNLPGAESQMTSQPPGNQQAGGNQPAAGQAQTTGGQGGNAPAGGQQNQATGAQPGTPQQTKAPSGGAQGPR